MSASPRTSRRAILLGASAAPIAALTSAPISADDVSFPDLVARFVRIRERWRERMARDLAWFRKVDRLVDEATGMEREERKALRYNDPAFNKYVDDADRIIARDHPYPDPDTVWDEIHAELYSISEAMLSQVPRLLADLAWQAEAAATSNCEMFLDGDNYERAMRPLFRNIFALVNRECPNFIAPAEVQS